MSSPSSANQAKPNATSTDPETVRRVLSVREPSKNQDPKSPATSTPKQPTR